MIVLNEDFTECLSLSPVQTVMVPCPFGGGYFKMVMGDGNIAEAEGGTIALIKYLDDIERFYAYALLDSKRVRNLDFT